MKAKQVRAQYTQEFKLEAVREMGAGQSMAVVATRNQDTVVSALHQAEVVARLTD